MKDKLYYLATAIPFISEFLEIGHIANSPREWITEVSTATVIAILAWLISKRDKKIKQLQRIDDLTGLFNKTMFFEDLLKEATRAQRYNSTLTLAYIDVLGFEKINKEFGNSEGDLVLTRLAYQFTNTLRKNLDICYRIGVNEFAMLLPSTKVENANIVLDRIKASAFKAPSNLKKYGASLSISSVQLEEEENFRSFFERALSNTRSG